MHSYSLKRSKFAVRGFRAFGVAALLGTTFVLGACAEDEPDAVETGDVTAAAATTTAEETETAAATETPTSTETPTQTITPAEPVEREGISFLAPEGWVGNAETWTSPDGAVTLLFATVESEPGTDPVAVVLPESATNIESETIETPLGPGSLETIELTDENVYERHAIVETDDVIYDWWLVAESIEELDEQQGALQGVLDSILREED